jgi:biopolymer transport protein ExbD
MIKRGGLTKLLIEPPSVATGDIAFNLIVFFLVCASTQPDSGLKQDIPKSESKQEQAQQSENIEVSLTRTTASINGDPTPLKQFLPRMRTLLKNKRRAEDRVVVVKSAKDTSYQHWITVTGWIAQAGGVVTLQLEEERSVVTP